MKEKVFDKGKRVKDEYLGFGSIVKLNVAGIKKFHLVRFYKTPPLKYNLGENPVAVFESGLTLLD